MLHVRAHVRALEALAPPVARGCADVKASNRAMLPRRASRKDSPLSPRSIPRRPRRPPSRSPNRKHKYAIAETTLLLNRYFRSWRRNRVAMASVAFFVSGTWAHAKAGDEL